MNNMPSFLDLWKVSPFLILCITSLFCLATKVLDQSKEEDRFVTFVQAFFGLLLSWLLIIYLGSTLGLQEISAFSNQLVFDGLSYYTSLLILLLTIAVLFFSQGHPALREQFSEHVFLLLSACLGMLIIVWSNDLIVSFVGIELMSLAFYVLTGLSLEQKLSKEAAFKYFILGSFASAILLYGIALIYGTVQSTLISDLIQLGPTLAVEDPIFLVGLILLMCGLFFKISIFPFHAWTPDVYQGAPTPVTAFLSTAGKLTPFVLVLRLVGTNVLISSTLFIDLMQWLAVLTMLVGNIMALRQNNFKRILAYSSIAHSGYALIGVIALSLGASQGMGASGVLFYFLAYALMNIGAFAIVCLLETSEESCINVDDLKGLAASRPFMALALTVCLLSLAGIPPTAGFFGKFYVFASALNKGLVWLVVWGVLNSVISLYYYLRPVLNMYMMPADQKVGENPDLLAKGLLFVSAGMVLFLGLFAELVIQKIALAMSFVFAL